MLCTGLSSVVPWRLQKLWRVLNPDRMDIVEGTHNEEIEGADVENVGKYMDTG